MAADRQTPTIVTDPADITGQNYATEVAKEVTQLYVGVITQTQTVAGTADAITAVCIPPLIADAANGQTFRLTPSANNTGAVTINLDARGAIALKDCDGNALSADDIVSGRPIEFQRHGAAGNFRLTQPTQRALIAALSASIATSSKWVEINDTTVSSAVAQIEHTFTAGAYSKVIVLMMGLSCSGNGRYVVATLRNASAAIVTLTSTGLASGSTTFLSTDLIAAEAEFFIDSNSTTKINYGRLSGASSDDIIGSLNTSTLNQVEASGEHATSADRVRIAFNGDNIDAGRVISYGLKV